MSFSAKSILLLFALTLSTAALTTPHVRNVHHHRAVVARVAAPLPVQVPAVTLRKRSLGKRCKPTNGTATTPTTPSPPAVSPSPSPAPVNVAPDPSTTTPSPPVKKPSPTPKANPSSTTDAAAPSPASGFMSGTQTGDGTFYATGLGSCGITNQDSEDICAVSMLLYDVYPGYKGGDPNSNPVCGQRIKATYQGKSVVVKVTDRCTGCSQTSLDFSPHAFNQLADPSVGRIHGVTWEWVDN